MSQVISFGDYTPSARFDAIPWEQVRVQEASTEDGPWTTIETITLSPVDADPSNPAARSVTTVEASEETDLWYRLVFVDGDGDIGLPTVPVQNLVRSTRVVSAYATVEEFARRVKIRTATAEQTAAMERVLLTAAGEIDSEIDLEAGDALEGWELSLAEEVNLERAEEHWSASAFGLVGLGGELGSAFVSRDSWERYALKLAPLKEQWGLA